MIFATYSIGCELFLVQGDLTRGLNHFRVDLDFLLSAASLDDRLRDVEDELLGLLLGQAESRPLFLLLFLLFNISGLLVVNIPNQEHGFKGGQLGDDAVHNGSMLPRVQVDVLERAAEHLQVHIV